MERVALYGCPEHPQTNRGLVTGRLRVEGVAVFACKWCETALDGDAGSGGTGQGGRRPHPAPAGA